MADLKSIRNSISYLNSNEDFSPEEEDDGEEYEEINNETILPSYNIDPPTTVDSALSQIEGQDNTYGRRVGYICTVFLHLLAFMTSILPPFMFIEPKMECSFNSRWTRCSMEEACSADITARLS